MFVELTPLFRRPSGLGWFFFGRGTFFVSSKSPFGIIQSFFFFFLASEALFHFVLRRADPLTGTTPRWLVVLLVASHFSVLRYLSPPWDLRRGKKKSQKRLTIELLAH